MRKIYTFAELSTDAQSTAADHLKNINIDPKWPEQVFQGFEDLGIRIVDYDPQTTQFGIDFTKSLQSVPANIQERFPEGQELHSTAQRFISGYNELVATFEKRLQRNIAALVSDEYYKLSTKSAVIKTITTKCYEFTDTGIPVTRISLKEANENI